MNTPDSREHAAGPKSVRREARAERLSAALKANLRRRKAQARGRAVGPSGEIGSAPGGSHDSAEILEDKRSG